MKKKLLLLAMLAGLCPHQYVFGSARAEVLIHPTSRIKVRYIELEQSTPADGTGIWG